VDVLVHTNTTQVTTPARKNRFSLFDLQIASLSGGQKIRRELRRRAEIFLSDEKQRAADAPDLRLDIATHYAVLALDEACGGLPP